MTGAVAPELAVLIATYNRRDRLRMSLAALGRQSLESNRFEVILAIDGSDDGTIEMVEEMETEFALRTLTHAKAGKPTVLNAALEICRARVCLFIDDDVIASPQLLAQHLDANRLNPHALCIGKLAQREPASRDWFTRAYAASWNARYDKLETEEADWSDCYGANFSAPREKLTAVGGFNSELNSIEDIELGFRLCEAGCTVVYRPAAEALHDDEKSRRRILGDTADYGRFCAEFGESRPETRRHLLDWFLATTPREVTLRRLVLALRVPPLSLVGIGTVAPRRLRPIWFGFVSRYAFWRGARRAMSRARWTQSTRGAPVLLYHAFGDRKENDRFVVPRRAFKRHLRLLAVLRYRVIGLPELTRALRSGEAPPARSVVITIDDGYADNERALPIRARQPTPVTLFLISGRLGATNDWTPDGALAGRQLLTAAEAKRLSDAGIEAGAHTRTHPLLSQVAADQLDAEVEGSRQDLSELLGQSVDAFAYPFGDLNGRAVAAVRAAGFEAACTVEPRPARLGDDPLRIPRIEIRGTDSIIGFLRKLWFGGV